jgi:hypothetical protein
MTQRGLPLESPNWWPIADALEHRSQRRSSDKLAAQDVHQAMREPGRLQALIQHEDGRRELLAAAAWEDLYIFVWGYGGPPRLRMVVVSRKLVSAPRGCRFFVWLPDYKNIFGDLEPKSQSAEQALERPEKRGRKATLPWTKIGFELVRRAEKMGAAAGNKSTNSWATDLDQWCDDRNLKAPPNSELRVFIDEVLRALRIKRK